MANLDLIVPQLISQRRVTCGFTTRSGGVSPAPFDSLNVGLHTGDTRQNIIENRRIIYRFIGIMNDRFSSRTNTVIAVLGPSAGPCCYEVGNDVARLLHDSSIHRHHDRIFADLKAELILRLLLAGIPARNIERFDDCTICNESGYFSYRRDGNRAGRMMGFIMLRQHFTTDTIDIKGKHS